MNIITPSIQNPVGAAMLLAGAFKEKEPLIAFDRGLLLFTVGNIRMITQGFPTDLSFVVDLNKLNVVVAGDMPELDIKEAVYSESSYKNIKITNGLGKVSLPGNPVETYPFDKSIIEQYERKLETAVSLPGAPLVEAVKQANVNLEPPDSDFPYTTFFSVVVDSNSLTVQGASVERNTQSAQYPVEGVPDVCFLFPRSVGNILFQLTELLGMGRVFISEDSTLIKIKFLQTIMFIETQALEEQDIVTSSVIAQMALLTENWGKIAPKLIALPSHVVAMFRLTQKLKATGFLIVTISKKKIAIKSPVGDDILMDSTFSLEKEISEDYAPFQLRIKQGASIPYTYIFPIPSKAGGRQELVKLLLAQDPTPGMAFQVLEITENTALSSEDEDSTELPQTMPAYNSENDTDQSVPWDFNDGSESF